MAASVPIRNSAVQTSSSTWRLGCKIECDRIGEPDEPCAVAAWNDGDHRYTLRQIISEQPPIAMSENLDKDELATVAGYPDSQSPTAPFDSSSDCLGSVATEHLTHPWTERNLADDPKIVQQRFIARHRFAQLISKDYSDNSGLFIPFCDDMRPSNMLIGPETLQITAVVDFEFPNAMPAEFIYDAPWWLLLSGPEMWLERCSMEEFVTLHGPRMEQFLRALERVEDESKSECKQPGPSLSTRMRDSGQFWFNYAARKSFDADSIYWAALHDGAGVESLDDKTRAEMESFTRIKMEQLEAYKEECSGRLSSEI
ncbi:hypothetical protein PENCOP_c009G06016 [Penicillium coprophilum]|uniref:Aminoglycoside phosphotransferase domain-containing protein n=1 Tax=Penicillium coprophilum TaxID=36646 RepID=A0A1V6UHZ0_9EURO|nr:hypothetical protein PENCOP_c009G06016 [Penicillium coprophilum]